MGKEQVPTNGAKGNDGRGGEDRKKDIDDDDGNIEDDDNGDDCDDDNCGECSLRELRCGD